MYNLHSYALQNAMHFFWFYLSMPLKCATVVFHMLYMYLFLNNMFNKNENIWSCTTNKRTNILKEIPHIKTVIFFYLSPQIGWFLLNTKELKYFIGDASYKTKRYICFIIFIIKDRLFNDKLNN